MKRILIAAAFAAAAALMAADDARIDLLAKSGLVCNSVSEGVTASPALWMKGREDQRLIVTVQSSPEWKQHSVTFTPKADGQIEVIIMGNRKDKDILYDSVTVKGATLNNGTFEELNAKGLPASWNLKQEAFRTNGAASGKNCVQTNHDKRATQRISVKGGQAVEIGFMVKAAQP